MKIDLDKTIVDYRTKYPDGDFLVPTFEPSSNIQKSVIDTYREFGYSESYILEMLCRIKRGIIGVAIHKTMGQSAKIIIDENKYSNAVAYHELTHVCDYYDYCKRHDYLLMTFEEFRLTPNFNPFYLFSEFRASYRERYIANDELSAFPNGLPPNTFYGDISDLLTKMLPIDVYYHILDYAATCLIRIDKHKMNLIYNDNQDDPFCELLKFIHPLIKCSMASLEDYFEQLMLSLKKICDIAVILKLRPWR